MKKIKKIFVVSLLIFSLLLFACSSTKNEIDEYISYLDQVKTSSEFMPIIEDINDYEDIKVYCYSYKSLFPYDSVNLIIQYSESVYNLNKQELLEKYTLLDNPIPMDGYKGDYLIPETNFSVYGFNISVIYDSNFKYPHNFGMLGYNDEDKKLCYMYYYDTELDFIKNMESFTKKSFKFS